MALRACGLIEIADALHLKALGEWLLENLDGCVGILGTHG
jgi:hypothetical protein